MLRILNSKLNTLFIFIVCLAFYLICYILKFNIGMAIFGTPLILYFPGSIIIKAFKPIGEIFGKFGRFSLSVILSFAASSIFGQIGQNLWGFNNPAQIWLIFSLSLVGVAIASLLQHFRKLPDKEEISHYKINWKSLLPLVIFVLALLAVFAFNPLPQNLDNYINILKLSLDKNDNFLIARQIFISFYGLLYATLKINIIYIYSYFYILLFCASSLIFYDYLLRKFKTNGPMINILYFSLLISPAIFTEVIRTMPQVAMLCLTIPALILSIESIKNRRISLGLIALFLAAASLLFHELGVVLVAAILLCLLINIAINFRNSRKSLAAKLIILLIALLITAVVVFLCYQMPFFSPLINRLTYRLQQSFLLAGQNGGMSFRWWFLNDYKTVEGVQLGWSGIGAVEYYLYGGILIFIPLLILSYKLIKNKIILGIESMPTVIYFLFFFAAAEILPRLNLAFLPNRAWVHMMLPAVIILALMYENLNDKNIKIKYFSILLTILIAVGYLGTVYLARINLYEAYLSELGVTNYIKNNTSDNALIISSQNDKTLVNIFAERKYGQIVFDHQVTRSEFDQAINDTLNDLSVDKDVSFDPHALQAPMDYSFNLDKDVLIQKSIDRKDTPVYFLYSCARVGGLNDQRDYRQGVVDSTNKLTYDKLGYEIVYSSEQALLLRIK